MTEQNNTESENLSESSTENLLKLIKDQNKELKILNKKLPKLEEKYIKMISDHKMLQNDKTNIESFFKIIFPKEMYEKLIKTDLGLYDCAELNRFWVVVEGAKQNEYQKFVNQLKSENNEFSRKNEILKSELDSKTNELDKLKLSSRELNNTVMHLTSLYNDVAMKYDNVDKERSVLLSMMEDKERQIEKLSSFEIENAELKAKNLLDSFDLKKDDNKGIFKKNNMVNLNTNNEKRLNLSKFNYFLLGSINSGTQTTEKLFSHEYVGSLENEINDLKLKSENFRKEFQVKILI